MEVLICRFIILRFASLLSVSAGLFCRIVEMSSEAVPVNVLHDFVLQTALIT